MHLHVHRWFVRISLSVLALSFPIGSSFAQNVPAPEEVLGHEVGADYKLATYEQAVGYFKALDQASPLLQVFEMGETSMGRSQIYAVISSEENMAKLDKYKEISNRLARAKGLSEDEARRLASEGKAIVWIDAGIHATECAPAQAFLQLAYDLLTSKDADTKLILENTIILLVFANPDGMTLVADWYLPNVGTPFETSRMPWLYHHYAGHDNNRDSYMNNLKETRNITRLATREWNPVVFYDHHQTAPFPARIWIPPAAEPTNPNLHPLFLREKNLIGAAMGDAFDREGKKGAISRFVFDFVYPGYEDSFIDFFNIVSIMTETALYRYATPHFYTVDDFPDAYKDFTIGVFYPSPWEGGWWRLKDAVDYANTASKAVLHTAAIYRERFLFGRYLMGKQTIEKFQDQPPYAWIVPRDQWDVPTAARMLDNLAFAGIEVYEADAKFTSSGITYPAGTWIVPMDQAFSRFVKAIFEEQSYPDLTKYPTLWQGIVAPQSFDDSYLPPYDMAGWTLPHQMGVKVRPAEEPLSVSMSQLETVQPPAGSVEHGRHAYLISPKANNSFIAANRILRNGGEVLRARESFNSKGELFPAGTWIIPSKSMTKAAMNEISHELSLAIRGTDKSPSIDTETLKKPRVALYKSWTASMDEGWTRWLLEEYEFEFTNIVDSEIKAGELWKRFDVLIIPSMRTERIIDGHKIGSIHPKYVGGISESGVRNIKEFVKQGGTLVTLRRGCFFALDKLGLPITDALKGMRPPRRRYGAAPAKSTDVKFACPGSVLRMEFNQEHPVAYGMPKEAPAMFYQGTAFNLSPSFSEGDTRVISRYPGGELLISGYLKGGEHLNGRAAAIDVSLGQGRVILLGFGVKQRAQPHGTFKLLFNSLFYGASY
ncbi:MAG: hypothetical protein GY906_32460 [bacterium]|nr:hypothetical protein [bacterium]